MTTGLPPAAAASSSPGVDALWAQCLEVVRRRRGGEARPAGEGLSSLRWHASGGFVLEAGHDEATVECFELFKPLLDRRHHDAPWVIGQLGQSLDGCVATHGGDSNYVNGPQVLAHLHRLRALCDAVIVGAGTAAIDNPELTTRRVPGDNPVRVVLDPDLRVTRSLKVFSDRQAPTLLACDVKRQAEAAERVGAEQVLGVRSLVAGDGALDLRALMAALQQRGLQVLFVEGGGVTVSRFIEQGCLDRLHLSIAPVIIGDGRRGLQLPRSTTMRDCMRPAGRVFRMGADVLWDLDFRAV